MKNGYSMVRPFVLTALWLLASLLSSSAIYAQNCVAPPPGLASWWPGDGNANDIVGINPGVLQNGATFALGQVEQAFSFDGVDDFVISTDNITITGNVDRTIEGWFYTNEINGVRHPLLYWGSGGNSLNLIGIDLNDKLGFFGFSNDFTGNTVLTPGRWYHFAFISDNGTRILYLNGVQDGIVIDGTALTTNSSQLNIGRYTLSGGWDPYFNGLIDEVAIYNRALAASEIQTIFNAGSAGKCKPVPPSNSPPTVDAGGPYNGDEGSAITLGTATATDPDSDPLTFSWSVDAPALCSFSDATVLNPDLTCTDDGTFTVTLTADDGVNAPVSNNASVTVNNVAPPSCVDPPSGLISWWSGDGNADDIQDGNNGVLQNGATFATGFVTSGNGQAFSLDGADDHVFIGNPTNLQILGALTLDAWVNPSASPPPDVSGLPGIFAIVTKWGQSLTGDAYGIWLHNPDGNVRLAGAIGVPGVTDFGLRDGGIVPVGQWSHVAMTYESTTGLNRLYVNGVLVAERIRSGGITVSDRNVLVGREDSSLPRPFHGLVDEVEIYNRALSQSEIQAIFNAGSAGKCKQPSGVVVSTNFLSPVRVGDFFSQELEAVGGEPPYSWSLVGGMLPSGVNLSSSGVLSGTPTELGTFSFTVRVTDSNNDIAEKTFTLDVFLTLPPPDIRVSKVGTTAVPGRTVDYFIIVENVGNVPATDVDVLEILDPDQFSLVSVNPEAVTDVSTLAAASIIPWNIPQLAPGERRIFSYQVRLDPSTPQGAIVTAGPACFGFDFELIDAWGVCLLEGVQAVVACRPCFSICRSCIPLCRLGPQVCVACLSTCVVCLGVTSCAQETFDVAKPCLEAFEATRDACAEHEQPVRRPRDPNEKVVIAERFIQPDQTLVYPIHFENIGDIEARDVFVTDELDPTLDVSTLEILTPEGASFDPATRTVRWELLNRNLEPGETDNVLLAIKPLPGLPSGTEIRNDADIQFEIFEIITTEEVVNIIDSTPPRCTVDPLPAETPTLNFPVSWNGTDAVGEIESFDVFVSVDGGEFTLLLDETEETSTTFSGELGKTYGFLCIAEDTAGNIEVQEVVAEAVTHIVDNMPPEITVEPELAVLWPPNHKYHTIQLSAVVISVTDDHDTNVSIDDVVITSVNSDEPENGQGDGDTTDDIVIGQDCQSVDLRAERQGDGNGRVYTINFALSDASGNIGTASYQVHVPHSKKDTAIDDGPAFTVSGCDPALPEPQASVAPAQAEALGVGETKVAVEAPIEYRLDQNYPNPFNPETTIRFSVPEASYVKLVVYDVLGRQVRVLVVGTREAGMHEVVFDAGDLPSGTYLYRLETPQGSFVQTMQLVK